ncbi:hypothetical protein N7G274_007544 [Stereocaulon virgatum]|uniref:Uncharacterized protein n=1 Tax=Stereocaulon virgatum TaxID=373712 RepID=A0ABR4A2L1_9LECA
MIMVSPCLLRLSVLITSISLASSLHVSKDDRHHNLGARAPPSILPSPSQDVAHTLLADSLTDSAKTDTIIGEDVHVSCHVVYGFALQERSCLNVLSLCPSETKVESWAYLSDVPLGQTVDEVLPIKLFSNDATCTIQALIPGGGLIAHASSLNVTQAAHAIYNKCVVEKSGIGGKAYDIGGDNMLQVVMSSFNPHVECLGAMTAPLSSCRVLVQQMRKDYVPEKFGRPWDITINYALPLILTARKLMAAARSLSIRWVRLCRQIGTESGRRYPLPSRFVEGLVREGRRLSLMIYSPSWKVCSYGSMIGSQLHH